MPFQVPHPILGPDEVGDFIGTWFNNWSALQTYLNSLSSSSPLYKLLGWGRIVESNILEGAIKLVDSPTLGIIIPEHQKGYLIDGEYFIFSDDYFITGIPNNKPKQPDGTGGLWGYLSLENGIPEVVWYTEVQTPAPTGKPCIGRVFTNDNSVTELDLTYADYLQSAQYSRNQLEELKRRIALLEGLITGTGDPLLADNIHWTTTDGRTIKQVRDTDYLELTRKIDRISGGRSSIDMLLPGDIQVNTQAQLAISIGEVNPTSLDRLEMSAVILNLHNDGSGGSRNLLGAGTLRKEGRMLVP